MKKGISLVLALALVLSLFTFLPSALAADKVVFEFYHGVGGDMAKVLDEIVANFNASQDKYEDDIVWTGNIVYKPVMKLDDDLGKAMKKLEELENINGGLPGLDCGACGAPSCRALAEDIVRGMANETDCIFKLRERVRELAAQMVELEGKIPPVMDKDKDKMKGAE
jgi:hypothetical protein